MNYTEIRRKPSVTKVFNMACKAFNGHPNRINVFDYCRQYLSKADAERVTDLVLREKNVA